MQHITLFPGFDIFISEILDGDFRNQEVCSWIKRPEHQAHGKNIHEITRDNQTIPFREVDGVYTKLPGVTIGSLCADCPVIILMGDGECATIHSGWRGTKLHICEAGLEKFSTPRHKIRAYIGPHISAKSYEVRPDFLLHFGEKYFSKKGEKILFHIQEVILDDLLGLGIRRENITINNTDTIMSMDHYSYRRDGMIGVGCVSVMMR